MNVYERRRTTRTLNFIHILIDVALSDEDGGVPGFFKASIPLGMKNGLSSSH